jgi:type IV pilus assembly protein PilB
VTEPTKPSTSTTSGETRTPSLSDLGLVDERELAQLTARRYGLDFTDAEHLFPILDREAAQALPRRLLDHEQCVPITAEDPIEYALHGVQQTQTGAEIGFSCVDAMRSFVRQDPDVILVGEIRDGETALEAIPASQTGHLALSTLHCNDAVDAVQRLRDLGMQQKSIASELIAVFAQRLAKRVCEKCNMMDTRGRIAVVEHLPSGPSMRRAIAKDLPVDALRAAAKKAGLTSMREQALALMRQGIIPFEELQWVLPADQLARD